MESQRAFDMGDVYISSKVERGHYIARESLTNRTVQQLVDASRTFSANCWHDIADSNPRVVTVRFTSTPTAHFHGATSHKADPMESQRAFDMGDVYISSKVERGHYIAREALTNRTAELLARHRRFKSTCGNGKCLLPAGRLCVSEVLLLLTTIGFFRAIATKKSEQKWTRHRDCAGTAASW
jgi:hypothetical protein